MTVKEVAQLLGCSELTIRIGLQQGVFPFGTAFKRNPENKKWKYIIFDAKVSEYLTERN